MVLAVSAVAGAAAGAGAGCGAGAGSDGVATTGAAGVAGAVAGVVVGSVEVGCGVSTTAGAGGITGGTAAETGGITGVSARIRELRRRRPLRLGHRRHRSGDGGDDRGWIGRDGHTVICTGLADGECGDGSAHREAQTE